MASKDDIIADLRRIVDAQAKTIERLEKRISELELNLAKALKNSSNSSKSPFSDIVKPPPKKADRRKKAKRGGQKGHKRKLREPLTPERVDEEILYEINDIDVRELQLTPTDQFEIIQHVEKQGFVVIAKDDLEGFMEMVYDGPYHLVHSMIEDIELKISDNVKDFEKKLKKLEKKNLKMIQDNMKKLG